MVNSYPFPVPTEARNEAISKYGIGAIAKAKAKLSEGRYALVLEEGTFYENWQEVLETQSSRINQQVRAPPLAFWHVEITTDPEKLDKDPETGLPYVASCSIEAKTVYIHPDFFNLSEAKQLEILYHELISHIYKGIRNEKKAIRDTKTPNFIISGYNARGFLNGDFSAYPADKKDSGFDVYCFHIFCFFPF